MAAPVEVPASRRRCPGYATDEQALRSPLLRLVGPAVVGPTWANLAACSGVIVVTLSQLHPSLLFAQTHHRRRGHRVRTWPCPPS